MVDEEVEEIMIKLPVEVIKRLNKLKEDGLLPLFLMDGLIFLGLNGGTIWEKL